MNTSMYVEPEHIPRCDVCGHRTDEHDFECPHHDFETCATCAVLRRERLPGEWMRSGDLLEENTENSNE